MSEDRIEALARRLVADMEITRSMGRQIHPGGVYTGCFVCLLGSTIVAACQEDEAAARWRGVGDFPAFAGNLLGLSLAEARELESGFMYGHDATDLEALGKRLRENVLAQRTVSESSVRQASEMVKA